MQGGEAAQGEPEVLTACVDGTAVEVEGSNWSGSKDAQREDVEKKWQT